MVRVREKLFAGKSVNFTKDFGIEFGFVAVKTRFSLDIIIFCLESAYFAKDWVMITDITCFKNSRQNRMFNIIGNDMIYNGRGIFDYFGWFSN